MHKNIVLYSNSIIPTVHGKFTFNIFMNIKTGEEYICLSKGKVHNSNQSIPLRIHSSCLTSETFNSLKCDCRKQLEFSMKYINDKGFGLLIYLSQEGRGIGLGNKIKAYSLQNQGLDTIEANEVLGLDIDNRSYDIVFNILKYFEVNSVDLITNNPLKKCFIEKTGMNINLIIPTKIKVSEHALSYIKTKKDKIKHMINWI